MFDLQNHIGDILKTNDPERYLACLYLPEAFRDVAITLYAFDAEIARIPAVVSEPMPGEIRIQWWRDLLKSNGNTGSGPLAEALLSVIEKHNLPRDVLDNSLEARIFDLYHDAMPDVGTYEGYLGETVSAFLNVIAVSAGIERNSNLADACGHAGVSIGISRHLSACAYLRARGQVFFPLSILQQHGLKRESWLDADLNQSHKDVVISMLELARDHLLKAKTAISKLPDECKTIFLPLVFANSLLDFIEKKPSQCLNGPVVLSPLKRQWLAFRGASKL